MKAVECRQGFHFVYIRIGTYVLYLKMYNISPRCLEKYCLLNYHQICYAGPKVNKNCHFMGNACEIQRVATANILKFADIWEALCIRAR